MKNLLKHSIYILLLFCGISCASFLDEKVVSGVSYEYLETKTGMETAINGVYSTMRWYVEEERYYCFTEYGVDYVWEGADGGRKDAFNKYSVQMNSSQGEIYGFWEKAYQGITRANTALMYLPNVEDMTNEEKTLREGELRFMRAYFYFDLVQHYGAIPLVTEGNVTEIITDFSRAPVADVYSQIISDLERAYEILPDVHHQTERGRATKWAAGHLLAKVHLTRGSAVTEQRGQQSDDIDKVISYAEAVIGSGRFSLEKDYAEYFDLNKQKDSEETIFGIEFTTEILSNGDGNWMHLFWVPTYENIPGMQRDLQQGRAWKRVRPSPHYQTEVYDIKNDARLFKMFSWTFQANKESSIPVWQDKYYYVDENGSTTNYLLYETPANLVGKPKFSVGDTAALFVPYSYGAKDHTGKVLDIEKDRQLQRDIAMSSYSYYPVDENTNHFFPCLIKWLDPLRPDMNSTNGSRNFTRMRLGETYLIAAEAYGRKGDYDKAAEYINMLRKRGAWKEGEIKPIEWRIANGTYDASDIEASTEEAALVKASDISGDFINFILDERSRELFGEMNRWEDLVRTETLIERARKYNPEAAGNIQDHHKLRPIPQNHIDRLSPKPELSEAQNLGYY